MHIKKISNTNQIDIVVTLAYEIWNEYFTPLIGKDQVEYMLEKFQSKKAIEKQLKQGFLYFLINNDNDNFGYMGVYLKHNQLFLSKIYIRLSERNKGYGRKAIYFIEQLAIEIGANKISLTVNKGNSDSIKAYEKFGFVTIKSVAKDIGHHFVMDDYLMEKSIKS
ncbi:MAG: GNAT family N-acetyltransferase [Pseudomonadota bacterium]